MGRNLFGWILIGTGMLFLLAATGFCDEQPGVTLDPITVTAERFPVKEKESSRFVTVVSAEEMKESGANNLLDALKRRGGFNYKAFGPLGMSQGGMNSELHIRGLGGGELVLINGAPIQGAAGHAYDLNTIPIDLVQRVEILKGAASTLYGADAMTGVINIVTKKPTAETRAKIAAEFGNQGYQNHAISGFLPGASAGASYQHLDAVEEISRSFSKGYKYDMDAAETYAFNVNISPRENLYFDYLGSYSETGFRKIFDDNRPYEGTTQEQYKNFADLRYENQRFKAKAFGTYDYMRRNEYTQEDSGPDKNKNYNYGLESDWRIDLPNLEWVLGGDYIRRTADYSNRYGKHHRQDYALFTQIKWRLAENLKITAGAREQFIDGDGQAKDYDRFLPSFGAVYDVSEKMNLFANVGQAFRAPSFNNLYYDSALLAGNPDLDPEEGWTYELGTKWDSDVLRVRLAGFYMTYTDKIEIDRSRGYPLTYYNAGWYETRGMEWELDLYPFTRSEGFLANLGFYTSGYWAEPRAEDPDGEVCQAGPKLQTRLGTAYMSEDWLLDINCQILSSREKELKDYALVNLYGKYKLWHGHLTFGVDNLFDEKVQVNGDLREDASNQHVYYELERLVKIGYEIVF